jgi:hypothetical protein
MVVEILVAQGDGRDSLGDHGFLIRDEEDGMSGIGDGRIDGVEETGLLGHLAEQEGAGIGGESAAAKIGDDVLGSQAGKTERLWVTVCHGDGLSSWRVWGVVNPNPTRSKAIAPFQIPNFG